MAASGIAEHNEARRKEMVYLRKAYHMKEQHKLADEEAARKLLEQSSGRPRSDRPSSYEHQVKRMRELGLIGNQNDPKSMERERRLAHYEKTKYDYSTRVQGRFSSIDYKTQW